MAAITNTAQSKAGMGLGPTTTIVVTDAAVADEAALKALIEGLGAVHSIAGVEGTANNSGVMHFALQGGPDASAYSAETLSSSIQAVSAVVTFTSNP
jgi:hypothetical protein